MVPDGNAADYRRTSLGNTGHMGTRRVFVSNLAAIRTPSIIISRMLHRSQRALTGPGPGYSVSIHVGSLTWISCGLMRTSGPVEKQPAQSSTDLNNNPDMLNQRLRDLKDYTIFLMHTINLV